MKYLIKKINLNSKKYLELVFLGQLEEYKGILLLIKYIQEINDIDIRLNIAGDGSLSKYIKMIEDERIIYHGKLNNIELDSLLKRMDIMIVPSLWYEPFGRVVIDSYKYSMPVITTGNGGLKELIKDGKTGYITSFEDIEEFNNILRLYKNKNLLLYQMESCKEESLKYSNDKIVKEYENLYKYILRKNK